MSLEDLITKLIHSIEENTVALMRATEARSEVKADAKPTTAKEAVTKALEKAAEEKTKKEAAAAAEAAKKEAEALKAEEVKALDYDKDIAPALTAFLKKHGRDAFGVLLQPFGAKKGGEVKAERYAELLAAIDEFELTA